MRIRIKKQIIARSIMALAAAGSVLAGPAATVAATAAPAAAVTTASSIQPDYLYHG